MMNFKVNLSNFLLRIFLTGGLLFSWSISSQAHDVGRVISRLARLAKKTSKTGGEQIKDFAEKISVSLDEVDPRLIRQIRETGALQNPMRLFSKPFTTEDHPYTFKNLFYGPDEPDEALSSINDETWKLMKTFLLRMDGWDREQVRLFFEGMKDFANRYGDTMDMDKAGVQLIYATGTRNRVEYEIQMSRLIESVVKWHGPEIQGSGALERLVESAWSHATQKFGFLFRREDGDTISTILNNPFYETLLRRHSEPILLSKQFQKNTFKPVWELANIFASHGGNPRPFLLETIEGVIRKKMAEALSGNYGKEAVENLFNPDGYDKYGFRDLLSMTNESEQFKGFFDNIVNDFM